jgi:hypothetical protein
MPDESTTRAEKIEPPKHSMARMAYAMPMRLTPDWTPGSTLVGSKRPAMMTRPPKTRRTESHCPRVRRSS